MLLQSSDNTISDADNAAMQNSRDVLSDYGPNTPAPLYNGPGSNFLRGMGEGATNIATTATDIGLGTSEGIQNNFSGAEKVLDDTFGTNIEGANQEATDTLQSVNQGLRAAAASIAPDPQNTDFAGKMMYQVGNVATTLAAARLAGLANPLAGVGLLFTNAAAQEQQNLAEKGVAPLPATIIAAKTGLVNSVGFNAATMVEGTLAKLAMGGAGQVGLGAADRGTTAGILDAFGYHDLARQYRILDGDAALADLVLGVGFGGHDALDSYAKARDLRAAQAKAEDDARFAAAKDITPQAGEGEGPEGPALPPPSGAPPEGGQPSPEGPQAEATPESAPETPETPSPVPSEPDFEAAARQMEPQGFAALDDLQAQKESARTQIATIQGQRDQQYAGEERQPAQVQDEIQTLQGQLTALGGDGDISKLSAPKVARVQALSQQVQQLQALSDYQAGRDTPEQAVLRQQLLKADYAIRDLGPKIGGARRAARILMDPADINPSDVDAAMVVQDAKQFEDAAPGIPADLESRAAHAAAMKQAASDMLVDDKAPAVDDIMDGTKFIQNPNMHQDLQDVLQYLHELPPESMSEDDRAELQYQMGELKRIMAGEPEPEAPAPSALVDRKSPAVGIKEVVPMPDGSIVPKAEAMKTIEAENEKAQTDQKIAEALAKCAIENLGSF